MQMRLLEFLNQAIELFKYVSDIIKPLNFAISQYKAETLTLQFLNHHLTFYLTHKVNTTKKVKSYEKRDNMKSRKKNR